MPSDVTTDEEMTDDELRADLAESDEYAKSYETHALRLLDEAENLRENRDRCRVRSDRLRKLLAVRKMKTFDPRVLEPSSPDGEWDLTGQNFGPCQRCPIGQALTVVALSAPDLAESIVESAGDDWSEDQPSPTPEVCRALGTDADVLRWVAGEYDEAMVGGGSYEEAFAAGKNKWVELYMERMSGCQEMRNE